MEIWKINRRSGVWMSLGAAALAVAWIDFHTDPNPVASQSEAGGMGTILATARSHRSPASAGPIASGARAFESLAGSSRDAAQAALDRWKLEPVSKVLDRITHYHERSDDESLETAMMALAFALKHTADSGAAAAVAAVVRDPRILPPLRIQLLHQMVLAGTKPAFAQILDIYHVSEDPNIRDAVLQLFPQMQAEYRISPEREDLTPGLIAAFKTEPDTSPLLGPLAALTAAFGSEEGIAFLLDQVFARDMTLQEIEGSDDPRLDVSLKALRQVYGPAAVPLLAKLLAGYDLSDPHVHLAGQMLARIADKSATEALVSYATHAPAESANIIATWVQQGNSNMTLLEALMAQKSFDSLEVKIALQQTLEQSKPEVAGKRQASRAPLEAPAFK